MRVHVRSSSPNTVLVACIVYCSCVTRCRKMPRDLPVTDLKLSKWIEAFYTGGPVQLSPDGRLAFTPCAAVVKCFSLETGLPQYVPPFCFLCVSAQIRRRRLGARRVARDRAMSECRGRRVGRGVREWHSPTLSSPISLSRRREAAHDAAMEEHAFRTHRTSHM